MKGYDIIRPTLDTQGEISYIPKPKKQVLSPITITSPTHGVQIIVAGGPGPCWIGLLKAFGGKGVTEKVELPANWDKLVEKYRDMVPIYARY